MGYGVVDPCEQRGCDAQSSTVVIHIATGREKMVCWAHGEDLEATGEWMFLDPEDPARYGEQQRKEKA